MLLKAWEGIDLNKSFLPVYRVLAYKHTILRGKLGLPFLFDCLKHITALWLIFLNKTSQDAEWSWLWIWPWLSIYFFYPLLDCEVLGSIVQRQSCVQRKYLAGNILTETDKFNNSCRYYKSFGNASIYVNNCTETPFFWNKLPRVLFYLFPNSLFPFWWNSPYTKFLRKMETGSLLKIQ